MGNWDELLCDWDERRDFLSCGRPLASPSHTGEPLMAIQSPIRRGPPSLISSYCRLTDNTVAGAPEAEEQTIKEAHVPAGAGIDEGSRAIKTGAVERRVSPAPRLLGFSERIPQCGCDVSGRARRRQ